MSGPGERAPDASELAAVQRACLLAREARAELIRRAASALPAGPATPENTRALLFVSTNIPGAHKNRPELAALLERCAPAFAASWPGHRLLQSGTDALGPFQLLEIPREPDLVKREAVRLETVLPGGRLLDLDVYRPGGSPVSRTHLNLPERVCFACSQPARECIVRRRHDVTSLAEGVDSIIGRALKHGSLDFPGD